MKILVVGLGLIGGSLCKAIKKYTDHEVIGSDINKSVEHMALNDRSIDAPFNGNFGGIDLIILCLYPALTEDFFRFNANKIDKGTLITDVCGIKGEFAERMKETALAHSMEYIGIHPMAGKEFGGYTNSYADLFVNANFIITPFEDSSQKNTELLKNLIRQIGTDKIVITTPENHDKMIAYTSQLAHIVSSAYVKSPELKVECGFSGGSFQDMTRVATMNEKLWTDLFMQNKKNLQFELDTMIENLRKYSDALKESDVETMVDLIREGRELKEENLRRRIGQPN